jgi:myo-inositol-1-phosphate synthase
LIELEARVFAASRVKISVRLESDDKPNSAGSIVDLVRLARGAHEHGMGGAVAEVCAYYMKSPPTPMDDLEALELLRRHWTGSFPQRGATSTAAPR